MSTYGDIMGSLAKKCPHGQSLDVDCAVCKKMDSIQRRKDQQITALQAECDGLRAAYRELSRLAREVSRMYSDTSWNIGAIRKLTEYIDNKDKEQEK